jgi:hypothetical protein
MVKIDEQFIKEKINPVVGFIFHTARQLGAENAPNSMDMEYLRQSTERVKALIEESAALTPRAEPAAATDGTLLQRAKAMLASDVKYDRMVYGSNGLTPPAQFAVDFALSLFADPPPDVIRRIEGEFVAKMRAKLTEPNGEIRGGGATVFGAMEAELGREG